MKKIEFKNMPDTTTPLNAENLNTMQDNIEAEIATKISKTPQNISASDDFNNITETGIYQFGGVNSANKPPNWGVVEVTNTNGYIVQKCYGSSSIATRFSTDNGSTWRDWIETVITELIEYGNGKLSDTIYSTVLRNLEVGGIYEVSIVKNYNTNGHPSYRGVIYGILSLPCGYSYNSDGTGKVVVRPKFNIISNYNGMDITEDTSVKVACEGYKSEIDIDTFKASPQVYIYHSNSTYLKVEKVNIRKITI